MKFQVEVTESAQAQIEKYYDWYQENIPSFATPWLSKLFEALDTLKQLPNRCPRAPEHDEFREEVRQLLYGKRRNAYRILFTVQEDIVYVLHVRHYAEARLTAKEIYGEEFGDEA
jgi:plasmid stabilization system protein ParE